MKMMKVLLEKVKIPRKQNLPLKNVLYIRHMKRFTFVLTVKIIGLQHYFIVNYAKMSINIVPHSIYKGLLMNQHH